MSLWHFRDVSFPDALARPVGFRSMVWTATGLDWFFCKRDLNAIGGVILGRLMTSVQVRA